MQANDDILLYAAKFSRVSALKAGVSKTSELCVALNAKDCMNYAAAAHFGKQAARDLKLQLRLRANAPCADHALPTRARQGVRAGCTHEL